MPRPFVFFDLGQTLVDEWKFIEYFDCRFTEFLNGFGARLDLRSYRAVRDSVIRDRKIGTGSVMDLVREVSSLLVPAGYDKIIAARLKPEIAKGRRDLFKFADDSSKLLEALHQMGIGVGIIANQSEDILWLLETSGLANYFSVKVISSVVGFAKPDLQIFELALSQACKSPAECVMVGDRLDTDICPAKTSGMKTVRYTNSLFSLQVPQRDCEYADHTIGRLLDLPKIIRSMISDEGS